MESELNLKERLSEKKFRGDRASVLETGSEEQEERLLQEQILLSRYQAPSRFMLFFFVFEPEPP